MSGHFNLGRGHVDLALGNAEAVALALQQVAPGHPHVLEQQLCVAMRRIVVPCVKTGLGLDLGLGAPG